MKEEELESIIFDTLHGKIEFLDGTKIDPDFRINSPAYGLELTTVEDTENIMQLSVGGDKFIQPMGAVELGDIKLVAVPSKEDWYSWKVLYKGNIVNFNKDEYMTAYSVILNKEEFFKNK